MPNEDFFLGREKELKLITNFLNSNKNQEKVMNKIKKSVLSPSIIAFHGYF